MKVIILAGGFGTRLQSVVSNVPKPMADIKGSPFLDILMQKMIQNGATEFVLCVSYKKEAIMNYFEDSFYDIPVKYSIEEEPLGTGGAIKQAFEQFNIDKAVVINGDTYVEMDYNLFYQQMEQESFAIALKQLENASRYGLVKVEDNKVLEFSEKSNEAESGLINAGVYLISKEVFSGVKDKKFSFEKDVLETEISKTRPKYYLADDYFIDIGIPESYAQACRELHEVAKTHKNKALFLDRDGVININTGHTHKIEDCIFIESIFETAIKAKKEGYKIIVITNQAGIGKGLYTEEDYYKFRAHIHAEFEKRGCAIDGEYFCPYHVDGIGEYRKDSYDRKPNPGMIMKAVEDFDIDVKKSILIGDSKTDIEAGKKAAIKINILMHKQKVR